MSVKPIFAVWPGMIASSRDGDRHFIGFDQLTRLYRVPRLLCLDMTGRADVDACGLINLYPSYEGNYKLSAEHRKLVFEKWKEGLRG